MDTNPHEPSGICQRLIRFVLGGLWRPFAASTNVLVEEGSSANGKDSLSSEIVVEFRHTPADSVVAKDGLVLSNDQSILQNGMNRKQAKGKDTKKTVTIQESERKKEGAYHSPGQVTTVVDNHQPHDDTKARHHRPLLNVISNINEKSEAFIERTKRAMNRNNNLDQDQKKK